MSFGISEEVWDKVFTEIWDTKNIDNNDYWKQIFTTDDKTFTYASRNPITERTNITQKDDATPKSFLQCAIWANLKELNESNCDKDSQHGGFKSLKIKALIHDAYNQLNAALQVLGKENEFKEAASAAANADAEKAQKYIFDNICDSISYSLTHEKMEGPDLRDVIDDTIILAGKWNILHTQNDLRTDKKTFFDYFMDRYGLEENPLHCCPHCGAPIFYNVNNCPSCFRQISQLPAESKTTSERSDDSPAPQEMGNGNNNTGTPPTATDWPEDNEDLIHLIEQLKAENAALKRKIDRLTSLVSSLQATGETTVPITKERSKILILGASQIDRQEILEVATQFEIREEDLILEKDYTKIKKYAKRIQKDSNHYKGIIVGPCPHSTTGTGDAGSLVEQLKKGNHPFLIEARTYGGELKITRETIHGAFKTLWNHLYLSGSFEMEGE